MGSNVYRNWPAQSGMKKIGIHGSQGKGKGRVSVMDNPNGICLGPGARDKVFLLVSLNQLGTPFIVNLQRVLAALGTE